MTDTEKMIAEIREALEKATPGKWEYMPSIHSEFAYEVCVATFFDPIVASVIRKEDANLIANAPEWLRWAVQEIERLREMLQSTGREERLIFADVYGFDHNTGEALARLENGMTIRIDPFVTDHWKWEERLSHMGRYEFFVYYHHNTFLPIREPVKLGG